MYDLLSANPNFAARLSRETQNTVLGTSNASSLTERVRNANSWGADYFISIHCNGSTNPNGNGTEAYVYSEDTQAYYLAQALVNYILILSPQKIVLGGGVMHQLQLFPLIRSKVKELLNGYLNTKELADLDHYIVPASLNDDQGIMGCLQLAVLAYKEQ